MSSSSANLGIASTPSLSDEKLRRWLGMLRDPDKLAASPEMESLLKAHGRFPENPSPLAIGRAGIDLLLGAIESLEPERNGEVSDDLPYRVLHTCFVDGMKLFQAANHLGLSERQLTRERTRAIGLLRAELENPPPPPSQRTYMPEPIPAIQGFLQRPGEARRIERALVDSHLVVVHGPPGIGKTTLVAELATKAAETMKVLWYRFRPEVNTSLGAVLFELGDHLHASGSRELSEYLDEALPDIDTSLATRLAIRGLSGAARLLIFDDFHLVEEDAPLRSFLEESVSRLPDVRVVAISQHRNLGITTGDAVEVKPFGRGEASEFISRLGVECDEPTMRALHRWTDGNPHMLRLAASWMRSASPEEIAQGTSSLKDQPDVQGFLLGHLTNLIDADDRQVLIGASVFRDRFSDEALAHVIQRATGSIIDASLRLVRSYVATRNRDGDSAFFHHTVREFVYSRIEPDRRRELHRRAAQWFEMNGDEREARYHRSRAER